MRALTVIWSTKVGKFFSFNFVVLLLVTFWFSPLGILMLPSLNLIDLNQTGNILKMNFRPIYINCKLPLVMTWQVWFLAFSGFTTGDVVNPVEISGARHSSVRTSAAWVILSTIAWTFSTPIFFTYFLLEKIFKVNAHLLCWVYFCSNHKGDNLPSWMFWGVAGSLEW